MQDDDVKKPVEVGAGVSRRDFLKISGASAAAVPLIGTKVVEAAGAPVKVYGPGKIPVALTINVKKAGSRNSDRHVYGLYQPLFQESSIRCGFGRIRR